MPVSSSEIICYANVLFEAQTVGWEKPHGCRTVHEVLHRFVGSPYVVCQEGNIKETGCGHEEPGDSGACGVKRGPAEAAGESSGHREPAERGGLGERGRGAVKIGARNSCIEKRGRKVILESVVGLRRMKVALEMALTSSGTRCKTRRGKEKRRREVSLQEAVGGERESRRRRWEAGEENTGLPLLPLRQRWASGSHLPVRASSELPVIVMDGCRRMKETCLKRLLNAISELSLFDQYSNEDRQKKSVALSQLDREERGIRGRKPGRGVSRLGVREGSGWWQSVPQAGFWGQAPPDGHTGPPGPERGDTRTTPAKGGALN
ncbi:hypothetical protein EYF80_030561 [Liparis tanakae]|uniref:Uncharacterized protein n=1 Tax=Liparis tanakae TaxID=230148 RepID=A0A4Z2H009_9TELE|nr:hypothetical protein EYF80_030561 [Liparis tanakae]